jgi:hypothetical protein
MNQIIDLIKKYCSNVDMLVVYGNAAMNKLEMNFYYAQIGAGKMQASMTNAIVHL